MAMLPKSVQRMESGNNSVEATLSSLQTVLSRSADHIGFSNLMHGQSA